MLGTSEASTAAGVPAALAGAAAKPAATDTPRPSASRTCAPHMSARTRSPCTSRATTTRHPDPGDLTPTTTPSTVVFRVSRPTRPPAESNDG
ncbi:hypothetical protein A6P39_003970 [Streptomyces sp. FXJ1.172]|uniref:hypothetical protein n=1 Tax=Streptomyces sp. FXJ1.172 TaxID=710705 RepID=UPI0007CF16B5|nr:hypothetical protein [Streptomyces sp. FXJ1.172]WEO93258.1 hypothetical protein A6P39_003970 [Streptomyces sp. FXJ1.172]